MLAHAEQTKFELATLRKVPTIEMQVYDHVGFQPTSHTDMSPNGFFASLKHVLGIDPSSQPLPPEGVRRGGPVLEVQAEERYLNAIAETLDRCGAEDIFSFTTAERMGGQQG